MNSPHVISSRSFEEETTNPGDALLDTLDQTTSWLATAARLGHARGARQTATQVEPLVLYDYEACPMCRRVREAVTDLGLTVEVRPCPRNGARYRAEAAERSGRTQFPFLIDPNRDVELLDSSDIVEYLYRTYGDGEVPQWLTGASFALSSQLATLVRLPAGAQARPSRRPERPLKLHVNESDPAARRVREVLCELEIPYIRTPGGLRLHDPTSGTTLDEVETILAWLESEFATD